MSPEQADVASSEGKPNPPMGNETINKLSSSTLYVAAPPPTSASTLLNKTGVHFVGQTLYRRIKTTKLKRNMVTAKDVHGMTALYYATKSGVLEVIQTVSATMTRYRPVSKVRLRRVLAFSRPPDVIGF